MQKGCDGGTAQAGGVCVCVESGLRRRPSPATNLSAGRGPGGYSIYRPDFLSGDGESVGQALTMEGPCLGDEFVSGFTRRRRCCSGGSSAPVGDLMDTTERRPHLPQLKGRWICFLGQRSIFLVKHIKSMDPATARRHGTIKASTFGRGLGEWITSHPSSGRF